MVSHFFVKKMKVYIETPRLIIREIQKEDTNGLFELDTDPEVHRYLGNKPITTMEEAQSVIEFIQLQYRDNGIGRWAVIEKASGCFIGWTGLKWVTTPINNHVNYYDLGYRFIRKYWGKGYAQETMAPSLAYGFNRLHATEIYAIADIRNAASNAILRKSGFMLAETFYFDEELHNWYQLSRNEWNDKRIK